MSNFVKIKKKINRFNKILSIDGDKSLSIRWALLASNLFKKQSVKFIAFRGCCKYFKLSKKTWSKIKISKIFVK